MGCGGSMVVHQTVKPAVPGSNPAYLQPAGTCHSFLGSQQGWHDNCRLASEGRQRQLNTKIPKNNKKKKHLILISRLHSRGIRISAVHRNAVSKDSCGELG